MTHYRESMAHASEHARAQHYLIIGPWDHAGTRTPESGSRGISFGKASLLDMNKLHKDWYDWTMKSGTKPEFLKDKVAYLCARHRRGRLALRAHARVDNDRGAAALPHVERRRAQTTLFASGALAPEKAGGSIASRSLRHDPLDTSSEKVDAIEVQRHAHRSALRSFSRAANT